jgi:hypothetical protein
MSKKEWKNHKGETIPAKYVPKIDKDREGLVNRHVARAAKLHEALNSFKTDLLIDCDAFFDQMMTDNNVRKPGKGNYSLTTFDKQYKIEVDVQDRIDFDDTIQVAHEKIKLYLAEITKDSSGDIQQIVNAAFQTSKGKMDVKRVLGLFELNINHPTWKEAMELIKNSIQRNSSKRYVRFWTRQDDGEYNGIELNFSAL